VLFRSATKILTALLAIENFDPDETVTVGDEITLILPNSSTAGLRVGEKIAVRDLLYGLMLPSGSDAAHTLAVHIARKISGEPALSSQDALAVFADLMNRRAQKAGAKDSHFVNPDGYQDENHYSTARDMAMIAREAMRKPLFREVVGTTSHPIPNRDAVDDSTEPSVWENTNALIYPDDPDHVAGATGIKTGYTSAAGHCLVSSASREGLNLVAAVLNSSKTGVKTDSKQLLTYGFQNYKPPARRENSSLFLIIVIGLALIFTVVSVRKRRLGKKRRPGRGRP
jgi:D-alanyl-D-alanine carboxypeptidase (penicillin-binding protein 5/6)